MENIESEIKELQLQIEALKSERQQIQIERSLPLDESPEKMVEIVRRQARENAERLAELRGIEEAIAILTITLKQKQRNHQKMFDYYDLEKEVELGQKQAYLHATRINQLADELATEVKSLKQIADQLSPHYWQVYYKPFITGFKRISVPYVRSDSEVWTIINRIV